MSSGTDGGNELGDAIVDSYAIYGEDNFGDDQPDESEDEPANRSFVK